MDLATFVEQLARPGIDTRQWLSIGIVSADSDPTNPVRFDEEAGQPLVSVLLEPSKAPIQCRVLQGCAGSGEGEWFPFVVGDEVLVAVLEGIERAGGVILGRLSNTLDRWPFDSVGGQDPTTNSFSFRRQKPPHVEEYESAWILRAAGGAILAIDETGMVTIKDSSNAAMQLRPDVWGVQGPSDDANGVAATTMLQINHSERAFIVKVGDAAITLSDTGGAAIVSPDDLALVSGGNAAIEHATSIEAVCNVLIPLLAPLLGGTSGADTAIAAAITAASTPGAFAAYPQTMAAIWASFAGRVIPKQSYPTGIQLDPGIGCPTTFIG